MRAVRFHRQGDVEVLQYEEAPVPPIGSRDVLIRVHACGVNRLDLRAREDRPEVAPMPHILGSDVAGEIVEVGPAVQHLTPGERVVIFPCIACGVCEDCLRGDDPLCEYQKVFGFQTQGGYAEYVSILGSHVLRIPSSLAYHEASALPVAYLTAWRMLMTRAQLRAGEDVLVLAAGGGVGSAALQIAKLTGARIFATASAETKLVKAHELGADVTIDYTREDVAEVVHRHTDGRGVDVVVEHIGASTWSQSLECLAKRGRLVTCGATTGNQGRVDIRRLYQKQWTILGSALGNRTEFLQILKLAGEGKLKPIIDKVLPLKDAAHAHRRLMERQQFGKVVLDCN